MSSEQALDTFCELWSRGETGSLSAADQAQLNHLIASDAGVKSALLDQLEVDALLRWQHGSVQPSTPSASDTITSHSRWRPSRTLVIATGSVASLILCVVLLRSFQPTHPPTDMAAVRTTNLQPRLNSPSDAEHSVPETRGLLGPRLRFWSATPQADTVYQILEEAQLRLDSGLLQLESQSDSSLTVIVSNGTATCRSGAFRARVKRLNNNGTSQVVTQIAVVRGKVEFVNRGGIATAMSGQTITVTNQSRPVVTASRLPND
ncbi:MAG: hypothetical protein ABGZ17_17550 [Planctomycetaceae bacterium]